jgi:hypothetical protein
MDVERAKRWYHIAPSWMTLLRRRNIEFLILSLPIGAV